MDYKSYFDIPENILYVNTPSNGLMPRKHYSWRREWESAFFDVRGDLRDQQGAFIADIKAAFGDLFHCPVGNLFLLPNFSFGLHTLLNGLSKGLRYALLEDDYPSLNYPVISRGLDHVKVPVDECLEDRIAEVVRKEKVDVLLLSIVQYISGMKVELPFIRQLKTDNPSLIIIGDATQYLGTEPFRFVESGFDVVGGSGYKWMMAGFGNGYMMVSDRVKALLYAQAQEGPRPTESMWAKKNILDTFFEPGHQDTLSHGTLGQSVHFLKELGLENIQQYLTELTSYAYEKFEERKWLLPAIEKRKGRSALINIQINPECYGQLLESGVKCFPRGTGIRIGLHMYNDRSDVDKLVDIIGQINK